MRIETKRGTGEFIGGTDTREPVTPPTEPSSKITKKGGLTFIDCTGEVAGFQIIGGVRIPKPKP